MQAFLKPCLLGKSLCRPFRENEGSVEHRPSHPTQHEGYGRCGIRAAGCRVYPLHLPLGNSHGRCPQMCRRKKCWRGMPIRKTAPRPSGRKVVVYSGSILQDCLQPVFFKLMAQNWHKIFPHMRTCESQYRCL